MERKSHSERAEYLSDLHRLLNWHLGEIAEIRMAIKREELHPNPTVLKTATLKTRESMNRLNGQKPKAESLDFDSPPYEQLVQ